MRGQESGVRGQEGSAPSITPVPCPPFPDSSVILASRSPRRLELLSLLVPRDRIRVVPPPSAEEAGFEGLTRRVEIERRLREIAAGKCDAVLGRLGSEAAGSVVVAADTVIVVAGSVQDDMPATRAGSRPGETFVVLGQPPDDAWRETTRRWFTEFYAGRTHSVLTGLCVEGPAGRSETIVETRVTFRADLAGDLGWYLDTGEPRGKAGGYAIQGAGSVFVERVEGSLTNVVGLPLRELRSALRASGG